MNKTIELFKSITIFEIVLTTVVAAALGVAFWGWSFVYIIFKPLLKVSGLNYLVAGFWIFASIFLPQIVRKPGIALIASLIASFVESLLTHWGIMSLLWGFVQGLGAELLFMFFLYRKWSLKILIMASISSAVFSYALDYALYDYKNYSLTLNIIQLSSFIISASLMGGLLSHIISKRLLRLELLDQFLISKN